MTTEATALPDAPAAPAEPAAEPTSLSDHEAIFGPPDPTLEGEAKTANEEARAKVRHRARSQQASPEDAPRIQELTKRLRETEAERDALKAPKSPPARVDTSPRDAAIPAPVAETRQAATPAPTRPKPSVDQIGTDYDTYEAYIEDLADWKADQRDAARQQREQEAQQARQRDEQQQSWAKSHQTYHERLTAFTAQHADFPALMEQHGKAIHLPAAPYQAILASEQGPAWVYHLLRNHDDAADLALLFDGKQPTEAMIAHATRWLSGRAKSEPAATAPAVAPPLALAPRPPNPVRTGAAKSDDAAPGDDSMSIEAHEKAFGRKRR